MTFALEYNTIIVLAGTSLLGAAAGVIGSLGLLRGRALLGDALAHATLPGICIAFLLFGRSFTFMLAGALVTGLLGVVVVALVARYTRIKEDAGIGIVLSVFFGVGIALADWIQKNSPDGAQAGINGFILGRTAGIVLADVLLIGTAALVVMATVAAIYKELKLLCFDPDFARVEGWPVVKLDLVLMLLLAVTTVIGLPAVGVVLMVALLVIPAVAARFWTDRLGLMLVLAGGFGLLTGASGTVVSASASGLPAGPIIVLAGASIFLVSLAFAPRRGLVARALAHGSMRRRRLTQALLRELYEWAEEKPRTPIPSRDLLARRSWHRRELHRLLARAEREGWIELDGRGWTFRPEGARRAAEVVRIHRLWEHYLLTSANIDRDLVDPDTEVIETLLPADLIARLEAELARAGRLPNVKKQVAT